MPLIVHRNRTVGKWFKEETHIGTWQVQSCWDPRHESGPWVWTQGFNCLYCYVLSFREVPTLDFQRMCFFFSLGEWFVLPIAIVAGIKKKGGSPSHHGFFSHYVMVDFVGWWIGGAPMT
jgi:hypothetical protein